MNRTDRLVAIVWLLRSRAKLRAEQLGEAFGVGVRTIYRDIQALCEAGVPLIALPGPGGGYALPDGYRLSPIAFGTDEVEALWLAGKLAAGLGLAEVDGALQTALAKIFAVASPDRAARVERLAQYVQVRIERRGSDAVPGEVFTTLRSAVESSKTVSITYTDVSGSTTTRRLTPERLLFQRGAWYVQGADSASGEARTFRLDRMAACTLTDDAPVAISVPTMEAPTVGVTVRMGAASARWYQEHPVYRHWQPRESPAGCLTLDVPEAGLSTLLATILSFGGREVILDPPWLAQRLVELARAAIAAYDHTVVSQNGEGGNKA